MSSELIMDFYQILDVNFTNSNHTDKIYMEETDHLSLTAKIFVGIILAIIVLSTIGGNILVLLSIILNRKLRTTTNYFIVSLAVADLLLGLLVLPFSATLQLQRVWLFGFTFCDIWASTDVLCCTASILSLCAISIDRYIGVTKPLQHRNIMSKKKTICLIIFLWILSFAISLGPLIGWRNDNRVIEGHSCTVTTEPGYVIFSVLGSFYIPSLIIIAIYCRIYKEAKIQAEFLKTGFKKAKLKSKNNGPAANQTKDESNDIVLRAVTRRNLYSQSSDTSFDRGAAKPLLEEKKASQSTLTGTPKRTPVRRLLPQSSSFDLSEDTSKASNESLNASFSKQRPTSKLKQLGKQLIVGSRIAKFNKEKRAAKTLGIVVGVFLICWFPFFFILPLDSLCQSCGIPKAVFDIAFWLGYCNSLINPIIYATWNQEFKQTFISILTGKITKRQRSWTVTYLAQSSLPSQAALHSIYPKNNNNNHRTLDDAKNMKRRCYSTNDTDCELDCSSSETLEIKSVLNTPVRSAKNQAKSTRYI